jgi:hypothetical protein
MRRSLPYESKVDMESPHCKLGPGKCRDCDSFTITTSDTSTALPPGWTMDHPWWPSSQMTDLQASHYDNVLQSVLALEKHEIQRIYEFLHKIGHTIYRE